MGSFERFRENLREALAHLYDPDYQPSALLYAVTGCEPQHGAGRLQSEIIRVIKNLEPPADVPPASRARRDYDLLNHRFVLQLTQEVTAERLNTSVRTLRRDQREATHTLARLLWEHSLAREISAQEPGQGPEAAEKDSAGESQAVDWRSQVRQDLASLHASPISRVADVREVVNAAVELERVLPARHGLGLRVGQVPADLVAGIHPSVLRQILIMAMAQLKRGTVPGEIGIEARLDDAFVLLTLTGPAADSAGLLSADLIQEILTAEGGNLEITSDGGQVSFRVRVPAAGQVNVLVVDDNVDSVHFYRRCTAGTRYRILHAPHAMAAAQAIAAARPDVIVLDIMLPDADGWDVLRRLRADPYVRAIPVIVCSIVRQRDLASALGAVLYLSKPVQRREFLQALDQALNQASTATPRP